MDIREFSVDTNRLIQGWCLALVSVSSSLVAFAILAQQSRTLRRSLIVPPGWLGAVRSLGLALLTGHMAAGRFGWLPWAFLSWQGTLVYICATLCITVPSALWWVKR